MFTLRSSLTTFARTAARASRFSTTAAASANPIATFNTSEGTFKAELPV
jgi:hypothetical protein